jgi:hypothetical protein
MARTIAMLRALCFANWDKIFYFSGQQWPRDAALVTERDEKPLPGLAILAGLIPVFRFPHPVLLPKFLVCTR